MLSMAPAPAVEKPRMSSFGRLFASPSRCLFLLLAIIPISITPLSARAEGTSRIDLTPAEQAWLAEHPDIALGAPTSYPPFVIKGNDGTYVGVLVDYLEAASRLLNHRIRLHVEDPWTKVQERAENREIDGLAIGGRDPNRAAVFNATDVLIPTYFSVFARSRGEFQVTEFSDLDGMRIGYKKGARPTRSLLEKLPAATLTPYGSHESLTQALLRREIDVIVAWISYDHWRKKQMLGAIDNILLIEEHPIEMVSHVRKDWPELVPILNKVIKAMQQDELPRITNKWFGQGPRQPAAPRADLTREEKVWLAEHPVVRTRFHQHPPYMYLEEGRATGLTADLLDRISGVVDIEFRIEKSPSRWSDDLQRLVRHEDVDVLPSIMATPEREKAILFTEPYISSPRFIFTRDDAPFIASIRDLPGKSIAVVADYAVHRELEEKHPDLELLLFDNVEDALSAMSTGKAFAFIGDMTSTPAMINRLGLHNLKAACPSGLSDHRLAMGVRSDWPELRGILDKAIRAIPVDEKAAIINRWSTVRVEYGISLDDVRKWSLIVLVSASGTLFLFVLWNRTLKRRVEERTSQLMETESRFRATFEQAAVGVAHVSLEGKFLRINSKFCEIVGYSESEMLGLAFQDITHPDDLNADLKQAQQVISGAIASYTMDKRYVRRDGTAVWINLTVSMVFDREGEPKYFVSVVKDIAGRKQAEEKLRQSLDFQQHLTSSAPDAVLSIKMPERTIEWANDSFGVLGYETGELVGKHTQHFYADPEEYRKVGDLLDEVIRNGKDIVRFEPLLRRKNGEVFHADVSTSVYRENGAVISLTALVRDISERKQAEYALSESERESSALREELIHATRRMAMGELTTAIAHELNQPLAAIMVNAQTARDSMKGGTLPPEEMEEILGDIIRDDRRAGDIIGKLRGLLKGGRKAFLPIRINEVVEEVLSLVRNDMLIRKIVLEKMPAADIPPVSGDRVQLQQVFLNLILNAADALAEVEDETREITVMTQYKDGKEVWISISDTGPGFDDAVKDRLFDPFYTTKSEGMGVGLAICTTIVKLHGGRIETESSSGGGATFHVVLPGAQEEESPCPD